MSCTECTGLGFHITDDQPCRTCIAGQWFDMWRRQNMLLHELGIALLNLEAVAPQMAAQPMFAEAIAAYRTRRTKVGGDSFNSVVAREAQPVPAEHPH